MIRVKVKGNFDKTEKLIERILNMFYLGRLDYYGHLGVNALKSITPKDTGKTADSWDYEIVRGKNKISIYWTNDNFDDNGTPIAVILQYGHATTNGGFVQGIDYINPTMRQVFEKIAEDAWKEATNS